VIQKLADIASKGGNFLLNVGPTAEGEITPPSIAILEEVGKWMKVNGESIYGTTASPLDGPAPDWGRITQKDKKVYLHCFKWPEDGKRAIPDLPNLKPKKAYLLSDPSKKLDLVEASGGDANYVEVPSEAPDANDSVIVLECE